jgi:hypothetical protein
MAMINFAWQAKRSVLVAGKFFGKEGGGLSLTAGAEVPGAA